MTDVLLPEQDLTTVRVIEPDGSVASSSPFDPDVLDGSLVSHLYETMVATRELDQEYVNLQRQGQLALYPSCRGQEAAQVGCASALRDSDWIFPQYRELGAFFVRGVDPGGVGLAWRGLWHGGAGLIERCIAPISIAIGTHALHAVGAAMASAWLGDGGVSMACIGDGATSEGDVHEALNLAAVQGAPCLFLIQNNGWAISTPLSDQCRAPSLAHKAVGYGMRGVRVDGNDVIACHLVVADAAQRARRGEGPTLIEALTYRMGPHTTSDDPTRYRSDDEVAAWAGLDPIDRCKAYLQRSGSWTEDLDASAHERAASLRTALRDCVYDVADGPVEELFDHVFIEPTELHLAQRADLLAELAGEA